MRKTRRKRWEDLSETYRRRLERGGITRELHRRGAPLHRPRGHVTREHERAQRVSRRLPPELQQIIERYGAEKKIDGTEINWNSEVLDALKDRKRGSQWVIDRLEAMRKRSKTYDGDPEADFILDAEEWKLLRNDNVAHWVWYHGRNRSR